MRKRSRRGRRRERDRLHVQRLRYSLRRRGAQGPVRYHPLTLQALTDALGMPQRLARRGNMIALQTVHSGPRTRTQAGAHRLLILAKHTYTFTFDFGQRHDVRWTRCLRWKRSPAMVSGPTAGRSVPPILRAKPFFPKGHTDLYPNAGKVPVSIGECKRRSRLVKSPNRD